MVICSSFRSSNSEYTATKGTANCLVGLVTTYLIHSDIATISNFFLSSIFHDSSYILKQKYKVMFFHYFQYSQIIAARKCDNIRLACVVHHCPNGNHLCHQINMTTIVVNLAG